MTTGDETYVVAIDAGTTGMRARAIAVGDLDGTTVSSYREFTQHFPRPGWVEHDAAEIWTAVQATLSDVVERVGPTHVACIGITNQRETVVAWDRTTGVPYGRAIVWQDRRTAPRCDALADAGHLELVRLRTGLVLDPYFSATKYEWLLTEGAVPNDERLALGTIDSWIVWNLTGGAHHVSDVSNASRTMVFDIGRLRWDDELADLLHVPLGALPEVVDSSGRIGSTSDRFGAPPGIAVSGLAGDQQAALFGQSCVVPGMAKNTYGTGSFVLLNVGSTCPPPAEGLLTTVAWRLADGTTAYALEGAIFVTGAAVQWLRDGLGVISRADEIGPLAQSVPDNGGVVRRPRLHRPRVAVVGSLRPGHGARNHPRHHQGAPRPRRGRSDGVPDARRHRGDGARRWHSDHRATRRRWCQRDGRDVAVPGRSTRGRRQPAARP